MSSIFTGKSIGNKRLFAIVLNFMMICSLVFSSFSTVFAQDGGTPTPEETSTATPVVTDAPTDEPTLESTLEPTAEPPLEVIEEPTAEPTVEPTVEPTADIIPEENASAFSWDVSISISLEQYDALSSTEFNILSKLDNRAVLHDFQDGILHLSGTDSVDQLRNTLYLDLLPVVDVLHGAVSLDVTSPNPDGQPFTVQMDARPTTGYKWITDAGQSTVEQSGELNFSNRGNGVGTSAVQTMDYSSSGGGGDMLAVTYKRSFEPEPDILTNISINFTDYQSVIDLTNPDPVIIDASGITDEENGITSQEIIAIPESLPSAYDWRTTVNVPIKDQGGCGSCWAFASVGAMEYAVAIAGNPVSDFSEQFLVSCNLDNWGCDGGWAAHKYHYNRLGFNQGTVGAVLESDFPYSASDETCSTAYTHHNRLTQWGFVNGSQYSVPTVDQIKAAIYTYGPVSAGVCADADFEPDVDGYITDDTVDGCDGGINHMVVLVGWDDATQTWILRNSWGPLWGDNGFAYIKWDTNNVGYGASWLNAKPLSITAPVNDLYTNAIDMSLDTTYTQSTKGETVTAGDPANVCNTGKTGSVWYKYTAPASGLYELDSTGSNYSPNLTVTGLATPSTSQVCNKTNMNEDWENGVAFMAVEGETYLFEISDNEGGGELALTLTQHTCVNDLCGVAIGGDGRAITRPSVIIVNSAGAWYGDGWGDYNGMFYATLWEGDPGSYKVITGGPGNLIITNDVTVPGVLTASGVGLPKTTIKVFDLNGNPSASDAIYISGDDTYNNDVFIGRSTVAKPLSLYAPPGTYSFSADRSTVIPNFVVSKFDVSIVDSTHPGIVNLNGSLFPHQTLTFEVDGSFNPQVGIFFYGYHTFYPGSDGSVIIAAPQDSFFDVYYYYELIDGDMVYGYNHFLGTNSVTGGDPEIYTFGGAYSAHPFVPDTPLRLDEGIGRVNAGVTDGYDNPVTSIRYYGDDGLGAQKRDPSMEIARLHHIQAHPEVYGQDNPLLNTDVIHALALVNEQVAPSMTLTDGNGDPVVFTSPTWLGDVGYFDLANDSATGTWTLGETVDIGPAGADLNGSFTFDVYDQYDHPLANDDFNSAINITPLPYTITLDTLGGSTAIDDPIIPELLSKGYASAWFTFVAPSDGLLTLDTLGSNYDTVLTVWQGTRGALTNLAYNDDYESLQSRVQMVVQNGETYYVEATQFAEEVLDDASLLSNKPLPDIQDMNIGGELVFNASFGACYTLAATVNPPESGGVTISPATNCPGARYLDGTEITLTLSTNTYYTFIQWSDASTDSPYVFNITGNTSLQANFALLTAPTLTTPATGLLTLDGTPDFGWNAVPNGNTYEIQIDNLATFVAPIEQSAVAPGLTYTASALTDGLKYWRVRAAGLHGERGPWSLVRTITIDTTAPLPPVLSLPVNAAIFRTNPTFSWKTSVSANAYQFAYDNDPNCPSPLYTSEVLTVLTHIPSPAMDYGDYNWCVKARDPIGNWSNWSVSRTISIREPIPVAPILTSPVTGLVTLDTTPDFVWNAVPNGNTYEIQIDNLATFAAPIEQSAVAPGPTYTAVPLTDGLKYWRVRAVNAHAEPGAWSLIRTITIDTTPPLAPTLYLPANLATVRGTPTFYWFTTVTSKYYQFEYDDNSDFSSPEYTSPSLLTLTHKPTTMDLGDFFWHVRACDLAGNWSGWSTSRTITIRQLIPVAPVLASPVTGLVTLDTTPDFAWNTVANGNTYEIQIDNLPTFAAPIEQSAVAPGPTYTAAPALTEGLKYWRVRAINIHGEPGPWSMVRFVSIDTTAPLPPVLSQPLNAAIVRGTPNFYWLSVVTGKYYQFEYDNDSDFSSPEYTSPSLLTLTHKPTTMDLGDFFWHVRASDLAGNWSAWSAARTITIRQPIPVAPVLASPVTGLVTLDTTPDFAWNPVANGNTYEIQIDNLPTFTAPIEQTAAGLGLTYTATPLTEGLKYWRVRAVNIHGEPGAWSLNRLITIDTTAPLPPGLSLPLNNAVVRGTPTFFWLGVVSGKYYQFEYDNDSDFSSPIYTSPDQLTVTHKPPTMPVGIHLLACPC